MNIKFCGAVSSVTGSCHLISTAEHQVLLDCGMFQGGKQLEKQNYDEFLFDPTSIECVILSHAHVDHSGRLPLLVKRGFKGNIYCTDATADILDIMLKDCARIQEQDTERANKKAQRSGRPLSEPLFTMEDAEKTLRLVKPVLYNQLFAINDQMKVVFNEAGHILGSAVTELWVEEAGKSVKLVYSGDIGMTDRPILRDPQKIKKADYVIMESTYGDRLHDNHSTSINELLNIIVDTAEKNGNVIIPSFAVGRTQELIYHLNKFYEEHTEYQKILDKVQVYIDSPMAVNVTGVFEKNAQVFDDDIKQQIIDGDNPLNFKNLHFTRSSDESKALNVDKNPKIIIAASGMCDAGRIRHHLKYNLWRKNSSIVFVGYQAEGTLGRQLIDGAVAVNILGERVQVNATVYNLEGFSGHADADGLLDWVKGFQIPPEKIFLVHGEDKAKDVLAKSIRENTGYDCVAIHGVTEYDILNEDAKVQQEPEAQLVDDSQIELMRSKLRRIHDNIEDILYNTSLAMSANVSPDQMVQINNILMQLEKDTVNLGMAVTKESEII